ncbi:hypothetical protein CPB86DRAFT_130040 [Serendipita vermifera]|nr:hypothetical protein CPB86DRAFT_130040 [Serendipita vermifera]
MARLRLPFARDLHKLFTKEGYRVNIRISGSSIYYDNPRSRMIDERIIRKYGRSYTLVFKPVNFYNNLPWVPHPNDGISGIEINIQTKTMRNHKGWIAVLPTGPLVQLCRRFSIEKSTSSASEMGMPPNECEDSKTLLIDRTVELG